MPSGGRVGEAYEVSPWEYYFGGYRARMQGRPEEERARVDEGVAHYPDNASMLYAKACVHAISGEREPALDFLGQAIERDKRAREWAATDEDFTAIRDDPRFPR